MTTLPKIFVSLSALLAFVALTSACEGNRIFLIDDTLETLAIAAEGHPDSDADTDADSDSDSD